MQRSFWDSRWAEGKIGFHESEVNPALVRFGDFAPPTRRDAPPRVLVPLCGKSLDLVWIAQKGIEVVGIEFVAKACDEFFEERGERPEELTLGGWPARRAAGVTLVQADFFRVTPEALGRFDGVYDRAALVAIEPERRPDYATQLARLAAPGGKLLLLTFVHDIGHGPPHSVPEGDVRRTLGPTFGVDLVSDEDILPGEPRFQERGATYMREQVWTGTRSDRDA